MMKFKSLFRRGQQSHLQHQQSSTGQQNHHQQQQQQQSNIQQQQQQQQVASNVLHQRQAPSVSSLEGKTDNLQAGSWSIDKDISVKSNIKAKHASTKSSVRMQELERELELLRKERARLEANLKEMSVDVKRLHELRAEITFLKVYIYIYILCICVDIFYSAFLLIYFSLSNIHFRHLLEFSLHFIVMFIYKHNYLSSVAIKIHSI